MVGDETWWRGNQWPPSDLAAMWPNTGITKFARRNWGPYYLSVAVLGEFVNATLANPTRRWDLVELPEIPTGEAVDKEIEDLIKLMEYRAGVMAETMTQCDDILSYWRGVLSFNQMSHPATYDLVTIALRVAEFQAMHYKYKFNRPRPSVLSPALMPPIDPPGHASFPSGHATESYMLTQVLTEVMPRAAHDALIRVAERVARNREVIGMHYRSDSEAGKVLAEASFPLLASCPTYLSLRDAARMEWSLNPP